MPDDFHSPQAAHAEAHQPTLAARGSIFATVASTADARAATDPARTSAVFGAGATVCAGDLGGAAGGGGAVGALGGGAAGGGGAARALGGVAGGVGASAP